MSHTPDRWSIDPTNFEEDSISVVDVQDVTIATVWRQPLDPPEWAEANADLIAAAPDLLAALRNARNVLAQALPMFPDYSTDEQDSRDEVGSVIDQARAAIAKAEAHNV